MPVLTAATGTGIVAIFSLISLIGARGCEGAHIRKESYAVCPVVTAAAKLGTHLQTHRNTGTVSSCCHLPGSRRLSKTALTDAMIAEVCRREAPTKTLAPGTGAGSS
jgi:hypothetical protein